MSQPLAFTIEEVGPDSHVIAVCVRCQSVRYLTRPLLAEMAPGQTLARIEQRVRCVARLEPRGPACGGRMELEFYRLPERSVEARASTVEEAKALADFTDRMMLGVQTQKAPPPG